jgi:hypothetical protein
MKITMQMLRDLGVCEGALTYIGNWFTANGHTEIDYNFALTELKAHAVPGQDWIDETYPDGTPDGTDYADWINWMRDLPTREDAITYHGDHVWTESYRTHDDLTHDSLTAAQEHRARIFAEIRADYERGRVINGVRPEPNGAETWEVIDITSTDLTPYVAFVWHDTRTGLNHRTESPTIAAVFDAEQRLMLTQIDEAEANAKIARKLMDESGEFSIWVEVQE